MARTNKARYAVLGSLMLKSASGYDIKKMMERSTDHIWKEGDASIYPVLKQLLAEKLVVCTIKNAVNGRSKKIYSITKAGKALFGQWLIADPEPFQNRNELLLKVFFGASGNDPKIIISHIENYRAQNIKIMRQYKASPLVQNGEAGKLSDKELYQFLTLKSGIMHAETRIKWCDEAIKRLMNG